MLESTTSTSMDESIKLKILIIDFAFSNLKELKSLTPWCSSWKISFLESSGIGSGETVLATQLQSYTISWGPWPELQAQSLNSPAKSISSPLANLCSDAMTQHAQAEAQAYSPSPAWTLQCLSTVIWPSSSSARACCDGTLVTGNLGARKGGGGHPKGGYHDLTGERSLHYLQARREFQLFQEG